MPVYDDEEGGAFPLPAQLGNYGVAQEASLQYQLDCTQIIEDIEHSLKCEIIGSDKEGNSVWYTPEGITPLVNGKGVHSIITLLNTYLNKVFILSNLAQAQVENMTISLGDNLLDDFSHNWQNYEIRDAAAASKMVRIVTDTAFSTFCKALNGNYLKFLRTVHSVHEMHQQSTSTRQKPSQQGGVGIIDKLLGKRK